MSWVSPHNPTASPYYIYLTYSLVLSPVLLFTPYARKRSNPVNKTILLLPKWKTLYLKTGCISHFNLKIEIFYVPGGVKINLADLQVEVQDVANWSNVANWSTAPGPLPWLIKSSLYHISYASKKKKKKNVREPTTIGASLIATHWNFLDGWLREASAPDLSAVITQCSI